MDREKIIEEIFKIMEDDRAYLETLSLDELKKRLEFLNSLKRTTKRLRDEGFECCICHKRYKGFGHNPIPILPRGRCCDNCNTTVVIPARLKQVRKSN